MAFCPFLEGLLPDIGVARENIDLDMLIERLGIRLSKDVLRMKYQPNNILVLEKVETSNQIVILNDKMSSSLIFLQVLR